MAFTLPAAVAIVAAVLMIDVVCMSITLGAAGGLMAGVGALAKMVTS